MKEGQKKKARLFEHRQVRLAFTQVICSLSVTLTTCLKPANFQTHRDVCAARGYLEICRTAAAGVVSKLLGHLMGTLWNWDAAVLFFFFMQVFGSSPGV